MKIRQVLNIIFLCIGMLILISACTPTRNLHQGQYMLTKNKVIADKKEIPVKDIIYVVRPIPNRKFLQLFYWKVGIYQSMMPSDTTKDNKAKKWMRKNFGEPIVMLDTTLVEYSNSQIQLFMKNKGYFQAKVDYEIQTKKKKAKVKYFIKAGQACIIRQIKYNIEDPKIAELIYKDTVNCVLKIGNNFDVDEFSEERSRMTYYLNNLGYFNFTEDYITYKIDSNLTDYTVKVKIEIYNPQRIVDDEAISTKHRKYYIQNIFIHSDFNKSDKQSDTIYFTQIVKKTDTNQYLLYFNDKINYKSKALVFPLSFTPGDLYRADDAKQSYNRFNDMKNFSFIKISYAETEKSQTDYLSDSGFINCDVYLSKMERNSLSYDLLGKNIGKDFGMGINIGYINTNIFKSGEIFSITGMYANEFQRQTDENDRKKWMFRNFEVGGDIILEFSSFLFPVKQQNISKKIRAKTILNIGSNFQLQDHYSRFITSTGFKYEWRTSSQITHNLSILSINLIKIYPDSIFKEQLKTYNIRIQEKYTDHLLLGSNYQLLYSSFKGIKRKNYYLFRFNVDAYGNLLYWMFAVFNAEKDENNQYNFWGIPFAGYVSTNIDFAYNIMIGKKSSLVLHTDFGLGVPTYNSKSLPFEKSFYLGGSNSMRAWRLRTLGPGSYYSTSSKLESTGDIKIEFNVEFRTPIYKFLHMAVFADAGNIWIFRKNADLIGAEFKWNRFYKEIALGAGAGLRLDFSFFVLRMDAAFQIFNPANNISNHWINNSFTLKDDLVFSIGVGYPF